MAQSGIALASRTVFSRIRLAELQVDLVQKLRLRSLEVGVQRTCILFLNPSKRGPNSVNRIHFAAMHDHDKFARDRDEIHEISLVPSMKRNFAFQRHWQPKQSSIVLPAFQTKSVSLIEPSIAISNYRGSPRLALYQLTLSRPVDLPVSFPGSPSGHLNARIHG